MISELIVSDTIPLKKQSAKIKVISCASLFADDILLELFSVVLTVGILGSIIIVANLDQMRIETTDLSERDIPAVQTGQVASVYIDALDETFDGQVVDIDRQSETVGGDVTYKVSIELDQQPAGLRWGMSAEVEIQTE